MKDIIITTDTGRQVVLKRACPQERPHGKHGAYFTDTSIEELDRLNRWGKIPFGVHDTGLGVLALTGILRLMSVRYPRVALASAGAVIASYMMPDPGFSVTKDSDGRIHLRAHQHIYLKFSDKIVRAEHVPAKTYSDDSGTVIKTRKRYLICDECDALPKK